MACRVCHHSGSGDRSTLRRIAGAGTVALEILRQVPDLDYLVIPVGGGGLLAGMALAAKELKPSIKVVAVEPMHASSLSAALEVGRPVHREVTPTLADGLAVPQIGENAFKLIQVGKTVMAL
jgi:threonine dehydratase